MIRLIASIGNSPMLPNMISLNRSRNPMARSGMSEEARESTTERMAEAQHSSGKAMGTQNLSSLKDIKQAAGTVGNIVDRRV